MVQHFVLTRNQMTRDSYDNDSLDVIMVIMLDSCRFFMYICGILWFEIFSENWGLCMSMEFSCFHSDSGTAVWQETQGIMLPLLLLKLNKVPSLCAKLSSLIRFSVQGKNQVKGGSRAATRLGTLINTWKSWTQSDEIPSPRINQISMLSKQ